MAYLTMSMDVLSVYHACTLTPWHAHVQCPVRMCTRAATACLCALVDMPHGCIRMCRLQWRYMWVYIAGQPHCMCARLVSMLMSGPRTCTHVHVPICMCNGVPGFSNFFFTLFNSFSTFFNFFQLFSTFFNFFSTFIAHSKTFFQHTLWCFETF